MTGHSGTWLCLKRHLTSATGQVLAHSSAQLERERGTSPPRSLSGESARDAATCLSSEQRFSIIGLARVTPVQLPQHQVLAEARDWLYPSVPWGSQTKPTFSSVSVRKNQTRVGVPWGPIWAGIKKHSIAGRAFQH